ncbi:MAG: tRNA pseudouridine(55) synthase TruB [Jatrophihabitans sp.]
MSKGPEIVGGLVVVDKTGGMTSHDVVSRMRKLAGTRKVGHAGTLDPMATGVLVIGVGQATRLLHHLLLTDKAYLATVRLGRATVSDDAEGSVLSTASAARVNEQDVAAAMRPLTGEIEQVPSAVSAIKVDGQRAHTRVRAGEDVDLAARSVKVTRFDAVSFARPEPDLLDVEVAVECSSGTYVRALARDLGESLGVGGHLTSLRRTRVGPFTIDRAATLDELAELADPIALPLADAIRATMPVRVISDAEATTLSYGQFLAPVGIDGVYGVLLADDTVVGLLREFDSGTPRGGGFFARPVAMWRARS